MDELQDYEIDSILKNLTCTDVNSWEQCRMNVYVISQLFAKKKANIKDIMHFPWDKNEEAKNTSISNEEVKELQELANNIQKKHYGKQIYNHNNSQHHTT